MIKPQITDSLKEDLKWNRCKIFLHSNKKDYVLSIMYEEQFHVTFISTECARYFYHLRFTEERMEASTG